MEIFELEELLREQTRLYYAPKDRKFLAPGWISRTRLLAELERLGDVDAVKREYALAEISNIWGSSHPGDNSVDGFATYVDTRYVEQVHGTHLY